LVDVVDVGGMLGLDGDVDTVDVPGSARVVVTTGPPAPELSTSRH